MFDNDLGVLQQTFLGHILSQTTHEDAAMRVYQNNYFYGLIDVLKSAYPLTHELLGTESFAAFARDYIADHTLNNGNRTFYGADFYAVLEEHEALEAMAWMSDFTRFEWAAHVAHHAVDAQGSRPEQLLDMHTKICLHPSVSILSTKHAVSALYFALLAENDAQTPSENPTHYLVGRDQDDEIYCLSLSSLSHAFITDITQNYALALTLERLNPSTDDMAELQQFLALCLRHHTLTPYI
jgi:hypothetical protein